MNHIRYCTGANTTTNLMCGSPKVITIASTQWLMLPSKITKQNSFAKLVPTWKRNPSLDELNIVTTEVL
jgi:hypothetical protein